MEWTWTGHGVDMEWTWSGHGLDMDWTWNGHGLDIMNHITVAMLARVFLGFAWITAPRAQGGGSHHGRLRRLFAGCIARW